MFDRIKQKAKKKAHHLADKLRGSSSSERISRQPSSVSINNPGTTNTPVPTVAPPESPSNLDVLAPSPASLLVASTSSPQPVVPSPTLPLAHSLPPSTVQTNRLHSAQESASVQDSGSVLVSPPDAERSGKSTAWSGLKTLLVLLDKSADAFGPLKSAVGGILGCIEVYERAAKGREDYKMLETELDSLFGEMASYLKGPAPPAMTSSLKNLSKGIEREIGFVEGKRQRKGMERVAEAMEDTDEILECYRRIQRLVERVTFNANISIWKVVDEQATRSRLKDLNPSMAARYGSAESTDLRRNACIPNTRIDLLSQLKAWTEDGNSKRIYWLNGMAGTGKTTIAYSLCDQLESSLTLAASFFCSRQLPACRNVNLIVPTVAYQLAGFSLPFRHALSNALGQAPDVHTLKVSKQFEKLIVEPLLEVQHTIPPDLVVVIDALDECDSRDGVDQILETLLQHAPGLPIKFFVTSRPEPRIQDQMQSERGRGVPEKLDLHNLEHSVVREDIRRYLKVKLDSPRLILNDANLERLVDRSGVLFIYAATVVRYIAVDNFSRSAKRLGQILATSTSSSKDTSAEVDTLYGDILRAAVEDKSLSESERKEMKGVLHSVVCAQEPLTVGVIAALLKLDTDSVQAAIRPLSSVLHLSSEVNGTVTTFHESFPDFMFDKDRSGTFHCDSQSHNALLSRRCFGVIGRRDPPFNICDLESSYVFDKDVPDLERRVGAGISAEMFYACRYWGPHLVAAEVSTELIDALRDFLAVRLLVWMEVMNLKRCMPTGVGTLHRVQAHLLVSGNPTHIWAIFLTHEQDISSPGDVHELALDAWRFTLEFSTTPTSRSTPHIYMSALLFWPDNRPISRHYYRKMRGMPKVSGTAMERRKSAPLAVCLTGSSVRSVGYSHDGTRIVSSSKDGTIRIWDAHTGQMVGEPLEGHTGMAQSVAYSHDGTRIVSGSEDGTIRIWDAHTGQMVGEPLKGHTGAVYSVAYSCDSTRIASGSEDSTIRMWDADTGQMVGEPLKGHTSGVPSVRYSHDGTRFVSGSYDGTIRIWDAQTGQMVGEPLEGHTGPVNSVAYSHDGTRIVSGSFDRTIRIWDSHTGQMVGKPFEGHPGAVLSVAYSCDGTRIVSGSGDTSIRIWDAHTGQTVGEPLQGHARAVWSVVYSHDGTRIVSGSDDSTIRIWDAHTGQTVGEPLQGHARAVWSVVYSHDGTRIVSGSEDRTIRIWDAHTGQMVGEPLEGHTSMVCSVGYSRDDTRIVSGSGHSTIIIWDTHTGQMVGEPLEGHTAAVLSVACSQDGTRIVSGSYDNTIRIWDVHTGQIVGKPLKGHTGAVWSVVYSHDGTRIVSGSDDSTICIWDAHTGQIVGEPLVGHTATVLSVAYSQDGTRIVSGSFDRTIRIWDAHTGHMVGEPLEGHTDYVRSVGYSQDGTRIVSGSDDSTICIWDAHTGQMVGEPLVGHTATVLSVAYSQDGTRIVSGSDDNTIRIWNAHTRETVDETFDVYPAPTQANYTPFLAQMPLDPLPTSNPVSSSHTATNPHTNWTLNQDGWVVEGSKLLIWVPPDVRAQLLRPRTLAVISTSGSLALSFSNALLGESWRHCRCSDPSLAVR